MNLTLLESFLIFNICRVVYEILINIIYNGPLFLLTVRIWYGNKFGVSTVYVYEKSQESETRRPFKKVKTMNKVSQRNLLNKESRVGEADRSIGCKKPKHLFSGKRKMGKTDRR